MRISPEEHDEMCRLYRDGKTVYGIAAWIGCTENTVRRHLLRAGLRAPKSKPGDPELVQRAVMLYEDGLTLKQVGEQIGKSKMWVFWWLERQGVEFREAKAKATPRRVRDEAVRLYGAGMSSAEVAQQLSISKPTVLKYVREAGIVRGPGRPKWST